MPSESPPANSSHSRASFLFPASVLDYSFSWEDRLDLVSASKMASTPAPEYADNGSDIGDKEPISENIHEQTQVSGAVEDDLDPDHFHVANIERIYR